MAHSLASGERREREAAGQCALHRQRVVHLPRVLAAGRAHALLSLCPCLAESVCVCERALPVCI